MEWKLEAEKLYKQGKSLSYIGKELNIGRYRVTEYLKSIGISHDKKRKEKFQLAEQHYNNGIGLYNAAKMVGISDVAFSKYLKEKGYTIVQNNQRHTHIENIFSVIDTEEKAYWLGFLYADGSVINNGKRHVVELALKEEDRKHVEAFKTFINTTAPITERTSIIKNQSYKSVRIAIHSKAIAESLINKGCTSVKSLTLTFPSSDIVPENLRHHFVRGYFEGDGTIFARKDGQLIIEILGTKEFLIELRKHFKLSNTKLTHHGKAYGTRHGGNHLCKEFLDEIYKDASIYLQRKYNIYRKHFVNSLPS